MITERELQEAIAECQGQRNPNANTCLKLASFYTILDHVRQEEKQEENPAALPQAYSYAAPQYESESEFGQAIKGADAYAILETVDELMETLRVMQPRLYRAFLRKLSVL